MSSLEQIDKHFDEAGFLTSGDAKWFFDRLNNTSKLSHHPICSCYDHHLIRIGRLNLCLGCTALTSGVFFSILAVVGLYAADMIPASCLDPLIVLFAGCCCYLPTLAQPFLQTKTFKLFSRAMLGCGITLMWIAIIFLIPWVATGLILKVICCAIFVLVFKTTLRYRNKFTPDPAKTCDKGCYPLCSGNKVHHRRILKELERRVGTHAQLYQYAAQLFENPEEPLVLKSNE